MPAKNEDLHGFVPDKAVVALPLIDVINDLEFNSKSVLMRLGQQEKAIHEFTRTNTK